MEVGLSIKARQIIKTVNAVGKMTGHPDTRTPLAGTAVRVGVRRKDFLQAAAGETPEVEVDTVEKVGYTEGGKTVLLASWHSRERHY